MSYDVLIKGGTVVDGSGADRFQADVAINSDRVVAIGDNLGSAKRTVDAEGKLVTPGFVDIHTCLLYTSPSPRDGLLSRMPSSA